MELIVSIAAASRNGIRSKFVSILNLRANHKYLKTPPDHKYKKVFGNVSLARCEDDRWAAEVASMAAFAAHNYRIIINAYIMRAHEARRKFCVQDFLHAKFASRGAWHGMEWNGVRACKV